MTSCEKDDSFSENKLSNEFNSESYMKKGTGDDKYTVLGTQKKIPCSVENMAEAYQSILKNPTAVKHPDKNYPINKTHLYVKFKPQDSIQYNKIVNDTILAVSDEPFEYEIANQGSIYLDPKANDTIFTFYYSVVPKDYQIPSEVPHEILKDLHFTSEDAIGETPSEKEENILDFYEDLNTEALKISDNLEEDEKKEHTYFQNDPSERLSYDDVKRLGLKVKDVQINYELEPNDEDVEGEARLFRRRKWRPRGTITVQEDAINQNVGVMGARVRVRKWGWLVIRKAHTNRNGYFETSRTRTKRVKYALYFKNRRSGNIRRFTVKASSWFWNARDRGHRTHKRRAWRRHYTYGRRQFYGYVQNAAFDYYTRIAPQYGLSMPRDRINISAKYTQCASSEHRANVLTLLPVSRIKITRRSKINGNCVYRGSDGIYATTVHELTHAGHQRMDPGMFSIFHIGSCNRAILTESWAEGVETIITNDRYLSLEPNYLDSSNDNIGWNFTRQRDRVFEMDEYTPIVADLIDDYNQSIEYAFLKPDPPVDGVQGYTLNQIQNALDDCRDIDCWENNLRNYYFNSTENNLNELFDYVRDVRNNNLSTPCNTIF
ncbi:hypothetical protein DFQ11_1312 [Winogradskyella epiphytica]|uniref:Uncharacterized protein n=1 Tax=Winogradskyella epiphytica TaxID=262005 RepID=A0A2V4XBQ8_9FLAO|nr:hypothetical protein [Winogradskyella epiphytica]PYE78484.1 hypothetical protein DFQ11_1312 [Winogradskyella epiphytica]GGW75666.1 hypothetical protein GCM10008085_29280 [Winogradskyella epiphytica]